MAKKTRFKLKGRKRLRALLADKKVQAALAELAMTAVVALAVQIRDRGVRRRTPEQEPPGG